MTDLPDLTRYSNQELGNFIRDLRLQIVAYQAQLEAPSAPNQRTIKLVRDTFLAAGGIFGATFTLLDAYPGRYWALGLDRRSSVRRRELI